MIKKILLFLFISSVCFGAELVPTKTITTNNFLDNSKALLVKEKLKGKIFKELIPAKDDYVDEYNRGTVYFNDEKNTNIYGEHILKASNYSFHKVIIPDGTIVRGVNFTQKEPHTVAIIGKNLTFIDCNLNNVEVDKSWKLIHSCNIQFKRVLKKSIDIEDSKRKLTISHQVERDGKFIEESVYEEVIDVSNYDNFISSLNK